MLNNSKNFGKSYRFFILFFGRYNSKLHFSIPKWAEKIMVKGSDFEYLAISWMPIHTATDQMKKIKAGYLLKTIFDRFTNKTQSTLKPDRNIWMYFAHDITIVNVLNSLGLFEVYIFINQIPNYSINEKKN